MGIKLAMNGNFLMGIGGNGREWEYKLHYCSPLLVNMHNT